MIRDLFPNVEIKLDYQHPELLFPDTKKRMEFDIYIPALSLIIEFYGEQHFIPHYLYGPPEQQQKVSKSFIRLS